MRIVAAIFSVSLALLLAACGGGTSTATPPSSAPTVTISASTTSATVVAGASQAFSASVSGTSNTGVTWSIQEGSAGGTIDATGKYTAPTTPGTYHIVVTSMADPTKSAVITVTVTTPPSNVSISISPTSATLFTGSSQQFVATVSNTSNTDVTWTIDGSPSGTTGNGYFYTAPLSPGTYHLVAISTADPAKSATATITVVAPPPGSGSFSQQLAPVGSYSGIQTSADKMVQLADGSILTAGGIVARFTWTNSAAVLSLDSSGTLAITQVGNMTYQQSLAGGALMPNGRVLIAGGQSGNISTAAADIYDPATRTFSQTGSMAVARRFPAVIPQKNGTILVLGGDGDPQGPLTGEFYDPASGTFGNAFSFGSLPVPFASAVLKDGRILFAGGFGTNGDVVTAQILDPQTHILTPTGSLTAPRANASAITLADGRVLIFGGTQSSNSDYPPLATTEIYDPATGTFSASGSLLEPLQNPSAILLPSGKVLVTATSSITAELYDPSSGKFSVAAQMPAVAINGGRYRMFNMSNGTTMVNLGLQYPFYFYHP